MKNNKKGFTLVELIVVIAIISILAAVLYPTITGYITNARVSKHEQEAGSINTVLAVESIFNEVNHFQPEELETLLVGMDYKLESSVKGYAFFYNVEENRVEFLKISDAQKHDSKLFYKGVESLFNNGLAYIDQSNSDVRTVINGVRNLVSDVRMNKPSTQLSTVEDDYVKVLAGMKTRFLALEDSLTSLSSSRLQLFNPNNGVLYFDHSGTYGNVDKLIEVVVFTPSVTTLKTAYANLKLHEDLVIELPGSVETVESTLFSAAEIYSKNNVQIKDQSKFVNIIASSNVRFTGNISSALKLIIKESAIKYKELQLNHDYTIKNSLQIVKKIDGKNIAMINPENQTIGNSNMIAGEIHSVIPNIRLENKTIDFSDIVTLDVRSKIQNNLQIFTGVAIDSEMQGYKISNVGAILDVSAYAVDLREDSIFSSGAIIGKRIIVSDPLKGYDFSNLKDLKIEIKVQHADKNSIVTLLKVDRNQDFLSYSNIIRKSNEKNQALDKLYTTFKGDYYFEQVGKSNDIDYSLDVELIEVKIYSENQLVFVKKIK